MRPPGGIRRDLRLCLWDAGAYGFMAGVAEAYLPAFGLAVGMPPVSAGLIATAPLLAGGVLQLVAPRAIARMRSLRHWVTGCVIVQALAFVPLLIVALFGGPATPVVFASAALYWAAGMAASAGWNPWMARVVPARIRGKFFGRRQGLIQTTMLAGLLGAGTTLHALANTPYVRDVFAVMLALGFIARLVCAGLLAQIGVGVDTAPRRRMRLRSIPVKLRGTPRASLLAYIVAAIAAASISGPFITPYLLDHQGLSYLEYSVFTATIVVSKIIALPVLGRFVHRVGVRRMMSSCALAIAPIPIFWITSDAFWWLLCIQVYGGIAWGGFELGVLLALFDGDDDGERTTMQVAFSATQAIGTAGASFIGGALLGGFGSDTGGYTAVFVASAIARLAAAVLVVQQLPRVLMRLPGTLVVRAWTLAIRPWGGTIVRPIVEGLGKLRRDRE